MTFDEAEAFVKRIRYKPNVTFEMRIGSPNRLYMIIDTLDVNNSTEFIKLRVSEDMFKARLDKLDGSRLLLVVKGMIETFELHEAKEWLTLDRKQVENPHPKLEFQKL